MHLLPVVDGEEQWDRRNRFFYFLKLPFCIAPLNLIYSPLIKILMEEVLSNQQARPGDATQLMHVIFSSDDE